MPQMCQDGSLRFKTILQMKVTLQFTCMLVNYVAIVYDLRANFRSPYLMRQNSEHSRSLF